MSLEGWIKQACELYDLTANDSIAAKFNDNAITLSMVPKLVDSDWKELIPQVGLRTALRKAAADLHADGGNDLQAEIDALRVKKNELQEQEDQQQQIVDRYKEQIQLKQATLSAKTSELLECQKQTSMVMSQAQDIDTKTSALVMELESLKLQKAEKEAEKRTVEEEREKAQMEARALSSYAGMS
eukprot:CAMPEP_0182924822 /NCGR_PEP_ID=MMETSP0105_2-20130417/7631_1 /TAXON_ID=81532 ORGANISM="Acanthoeca-like sp., Strain 10tr" /NCGR_SAMPLE_ID=MMETSP0105_2 /ASSEMBLY_ACC=CAM_ASM_000205 /LENGTH=184 /DNA_ID=CAMNT_0025062635 /DNA_START=48 /DNA_END=602 /DNA_ORIENTATION=+